MLILLTAMIKETIVFFVTIFAGLAWAVVPEDKIDSLPGINFKINFNQYSGYLQPDPNNFFHYWFVESQNNPSKDPVVLWLNGGPGCSSLFGLMEENGPFTVTGDGATVVENVYAWNKVNNVLYLESPAGVGFSWSNDTSITYNDDQTANLNYKALLDFFDKYPEYANAKLYITGESYGGVYLPMLADQIINDKSNKSLLPRFEGVAIGNGDMTNPYLQNSLVPFMYTHLLVGEDLWSKVSEQCCDGNPMKCNYYEIVQKKDPSNNCYNWTILISNMPTVVGLDPYNLYDTCYVDTSVQNRMQTVEYANFLRKFNTNLETIREIAVQNGIKPVYKTSDPPANGSPNCYYDYNNQYVKYLNRADVKAALHVQSSITYQDCNMDINEKYVQQYVDQTAHLQTILNADVPILCYNGDVDTVCNGLGDQRFLHENLSLTQIGKTVPWNYTHDTYVVAGWETRYHGLDFLTVRGSGHYVPHDKPREALQMIVNFIRKQNYSTATGIDVTPQPLLTSSAYGINKTAQSALTLAIVWVVFSLLTKFI